MTKVEAIAFWLTIAAYALSVVAALSAVAFRRDALRRAVLVLAAAGWVLHTVAIVARWVATGHAPVQGAYENSLAGAWFIPLLAGLVARWHARALRALPVATAVALLLLGNGIMSPAELAPLEPPYRSSWLAVHVTFAWIAFGSYLVASGLAGHFLWVRWRRPGESRNDVVDDLATRLVGLGFLAHSVMIASGAVWAYGLWGRYWAWDPVETWSFVSWLSYGVFLHLRFTLGWSGVRAAVVVVAATFTILTLFFGIGAVTSVHTQLL